ncbi:MAG: hypothetical protein NVSMB57_14220 [Actinomycetota bacterium]
MHALALLAQSDYAAARVKLDEALELARRSGRSVQAAHVLTNLGIIEYFAGDYEAASVLYQEALDIHLAHGQHRGINSLRFNLAEAAMDMARLDEAAVLFREVWVDCRDRNLRWSSTGLIRGFAEIFERRGDLERAACLLGAHEQFVERYGAEAWSQSQHEAQAMRLRSLLGDSEFERACNRGRTMTPQEIDRIVLEDIRSTS